MPFIPHTEHEVKEMLDTIGVETIDDLFDEIPRELRAKELTAIPKGLTEMQVSALMDNHARKDGQPVCFIGAGAYDHHIPAAVWQITTRGEYYSAYTPYQAEASQGTLQLLYEYQSMMTAIMDMDVSNASLYDGATAFAESILMAVRANKKSKSKRILVPRNLHPAYRKVAETIVHNQKIELIELPFDTKTGEIDQKSLNSFEKEDFAALVIAQPNFFGVLEQADFLTDWAHKNNMLSIGVVNPLVMTIIKPPGQWGQSGADIVVGEGQPLGAPLSSGGPYFGFMCCTKQLVRQMPGRIIGRTVDLDGNSGYALTLQAREQHIRRSKATSNICTNQGLLVTAATIHMSLLGAEGLANVATLCHANTNELAQILCSIDGVEETFKSPSFHERVLSMPTKAKAILEKIAKEDILGGYDLQKDYPELGDAILVCATEKRTSEDMRNFGAALKKAVNI